MVGATYITSLQAEIAMKDVELQSTTKVIDAYRTSETTVAMIDNMRADIDDRMKTLQASMKKGFKEAKQNDPTAKRWAEDTVPCSVLATDTSVPITVWVQYCGQSGINRLAAPAPTKNATNTVTGITR